MDRGHIITDDIVINYKNSDKDDALHFLTDIDVKPYQPMKSLSEYISPTAKRILTSHFNAWFLKANYGVENVEGYNVNTKIKVVYKGTKYICSFIDAKYSVGSISVLIWGPFGTCLYTGNFCYYPNYLHAPLLASIVQRKKLLNTVYLDATYYEQKSEFCGVEENIEKAVRIIKSSTTKKIHIYTEKLTMDPIIADLASQLEENVYVDQARMETMKLLGYEKYFTTDITRSRIFISKGYIQKRGAQDVVIIFHRHEEPTLEFEPCSVNKAKNIFNFHFYCHSNHKECCYMINILKPEKLIPIHSSFIDRSKFTIAPVLNSLGEMKSFSVSSSFKNTQPPNSSTKTQASTTEFCVNKSPLIKKENLASQLSHNSTRLNSFVRRNLFRNGNSVKSIKIDEKCLHTQIGCEQRALGSRITLKEDIQNTTFKTNMRKPNKTLPEEVHENNNSELVIAATFSLNEQESLANRSSNSAAGYMELTQKKNNLRYQDATISLLSNKKLPEEHDLEQGNLQENSDISQKLLNEGRLKIRNVSEINLLSEAKKNSAQVTSEDQKKHVSIMIPETFDNKRKSGVQNTTENCFAKDASLLSLLKVSEKPKSILLSKPKINKPCVDHLKRNKEHENDSLKIDKSNLANYRDTQKNDKLKKKVKKPLWTNRPLYIYEDKRIIPAKQQISLLTKNNKNNVDELKFNETKCGILRNDAKVAETLSLKSILKIQGRESPDDANHNIRSTQNPSKLTEKVERISYPSFNGNTQTFLLSKCMNTNVVVVSINDVSNIKQSDADVKDLLDITTESPKTDIKYEKMNSLYEYDHLKKTKERSNINHSIKSISISGKLIQEEKRIQNSIASFMQRLEIYNKLDKSINQTEITKETSETPCQPSLSKILKGTRENSNNIQDVITISIPEKLIKGQDKFENSINSLIKQIEIINKHDKGINQPKITQGSHDTLCEPHLSKNKLVKNTLENRTFKSSATFSMKDIFVSSHDSENNSCEHDIVVDHNLDGRLSNDNHSNHPCKESSDNSVQLIKQIDSDEFVSSISLSNENSGFSETKKRKIDSNESVLHKKMRSLRSTQIDTQEIMSRTNGAFIESSDSESSAPGSTCINQETAHNLDSSLLEKYQIKPCMVLLDRKDISRRHFFSPIHGAYVAKFYGFTKTEIKRRRTTNYLRIYNRVNH